VAGGLQLGVSAQFARVSDPGRSAAEIGEEKAVEEPIRGKPEADFPLRLTPANDARFPLSHSHDGGDPSSAVLEVQSQNRGASMDAGQALYSTRLHADLV